MASLPQCNPPLRHPGPEQHPRVKAATTATQRFTLALRAGDRLETAVIEGFAKAGFESGFAELDGLACAQIDYVIPAHSDTPDRLAWYSAPHSTYGPATIKHGYMSVGRYQGAGFTHCHALWEDAGGASGIGHLLSDQTLIARDTTLEVAGFSSARFERLPDAETRFEIFAAIGESLPETAPKTAQAIITTLRPNIDIATACEELCMQHGIARARVVGLGSLNGAAFTNGARMRDFASEFVLCNGAVAGGEALIDIAVVDSHANQFLGQLIRSKACVSVTAELVIIPI